MSKLIRTGLSALVLAALVAATSSAAIAESILGIELPNLAAPVQERIQQEHRVALVVGNAQYLAPLKSPTADAKAMTAVLRHLGFDVTQVLDADREAMKRAIADFTTRLQGTQDVGLFYFSGHGVVIDGGEFLVPLGLAETADEVTIRHYAISVGSLFDGMAGRPGVNLLFFDAARTDPFIKGLSNNGHAFVRTSRGSIVGYAAGQGGTAFDSVANSPNSPFTAALLRALVKPDAEIATLFPSIVGEVAAVTNGTQVPQFVYSLTAPFYFIPPANAQ